MSVDTRRVCFSLRPLNLLNRPPLDLLRLLHQLRKFDPPLGLQLEDAKEEGSRFRSEREDRKGGFRVDHEAMEVRVVNRCFSPSGKFKVIDQLAEGVTGRASET